MRSQRHSAAARGSRGGLRSPCTRAMLRIHHPRPCSRPDAGVFAPQASAFTVLPAARDGEALLSVRREGGPSAEGLPAEAVLEYEAWQREVREDTWHDASRTRPGHVLARWSCGSCGRCRCCATASYSKRRSCAHQRALARGSCPASAPRCAARGAAKWRRRASSFEGRRRSVTRAPTRRSCACGGS